MKNNRHSLLIIVMVIICLLGNVSKSYAAPVYNGTHVEGTMGICPYYGLLIYPDIWNEMNSAFVNCNGAAGSYALALWSNKAHSKNDYPNSVGDNINAIFTKTDTSSDYLGQTTRRYEVNTGKVIEADINFNMRYPFGIGASSSSYDLISVLTHELGHVLGLDHDSNKNAVMYYSLSKNTVKRNFLASEKNALYNLYH